jgi:tetratricopeptide (TPR) repeat protein
MLIRYALAIALTIGVATAALAAGSSSKSTPAKLDNFGIAEKAVKAGDYKRAIPLLQEVIAKNPNHYDALNYLGFSHRQLGKNDTALDYYKKVLAMIWRRSNWPSSTSSASSAARSSTTWRPPSKST